MRVEALLITACIGGSVILAGLAVFAIRNRASRRLLAFLIGFGLIDLVVYYAYAALGRQLSPIDVYVLVMGAGTIVFIAIPLVRFAFRRPDVERHDRTEPL